MSWPMRPQRAKFEYQTWIKNDIYHEKNCAILSSVIRLRKQPLAKRPKRRGARRNGCFRSLLRYWSIVEYYSRSLNITSTVVS